MNKEKIKKAFREAEKELEQTQIDEVKKIVKKTLEKLENLKKEKAELDSKIKILRMDLDDIKEGRLDRIAERQEKDEKAKKTSVVVIIKEKEVIREVSPWYWPYRIIWYYPTYPYLTFDSSGTGNYDVTNTGTTITCSIAKNYSAGCYDVDGNIVNFR